MVFTTDVAVARARVDGFRALIDRVPVGLVWLDEAGRPQHWNEQAAAFLASPFSDRLVETISSLHQTCRESGGCAQAQFELGHGERLQVAIAPDRVPRQFLVVLDRQKLERARAEASVLRAVLKAVGNSTSRNDAVRKALDAVRASMPVSHLALFEPDATGALICTAATGVAEAELAALEPIPRDAAQSVLAMGLHGQHMVPPVDIGRSAKVPFQTAPGLAVVVMPVGSRGPRGVLYVAAMPDTLNEGALRLVQALSDAIAALIEIAALESEASKARELASQQDRLATIGQLVAGVAHEINNPLSFLKSNLHSLKEEVDGLKDREPRERSELDEVDDIVSESLIGVTRIQTLVRALQGTARSRDEHVRFDPARAIAEAVTIFRGAKKAEVEVVADLALVPEVTGSPSALGQVVLNLLQNGLDAMSTVPRSRRRLEVTVSTIDDAVRLTVRDFGTGIPPDVQRRMYEAFFTTKAVGKGTGLGLSICRDLVDAMHGRIEFTTGPDGTTFVLTLPAASGA
ncbi:MAG: HAMP domain-containing histidine kinase [Archangium sp.]|nr:HAMP domain-containing histidine kinase [Archangium sp.]